MRPELKLLLVFFLVCHTTSFSKTYEAFEIDKTSVSPGIYKLYINPFLGQIINNFNNYLYNAQGSETKFQIKDVASILKKVHALVPQKPDSDFFRRELSNIDQITLRIISQHSRRSQSHISGDIFLIAMREVASVSQNLSNLATAIYLAKKESDLKKVFHTKIKIKESLGNLEKKLETIIFAQLEKEERELLLPFFREFIRPLGMSRVEHKKFMPLVDDLNISINTLHHKISKLNNASLKKLSSRMHFYWNGVLKTFL